MQNSQVLMIPVGEIFPDSSQPRQHFDKEVIDRMAASIAARGVLQPIRVRRDEERGAWLILSGECRWRGAIQAKLAEIPALPVHHELSEIDKLSDMLIENVVREELLPMELSRSLVRLRKLKNCSAETLAEELGISGATVSRSAKLLKLPEDVQALIDDGSVAPDSAYHISMLPDEASQREMAQKVATQRLSRDATAAAVQGLLPPKTKKPQPERATYRLAGGVTFAVSAPTKLTLDMVIEAADQLRQHAEGLKKGLKDISELPASLAAPAVIAIKAKPAAKAKPAKPATPLNHPTTG